MEYFLQLAEKGNSIALSNIEVQILQQAALMGNQIAQGIIN